MAPLLQDNFIEDGVTEDRAIAPTDLDLYPESDGKPMAENTEQYRWIVIFKENLEILFASEPEVFIAADLLWYPREASQPNSEDFTLRSQAPDVMVIFGRPKGRRGSYRQWEEAQIPPQVVFEILSPSNKTKKGVREMRLKLNFYQTYGVEEYYIYDPETNKLQGWLHQGQSLEPILNLQDWVSPRLGIRFDRLSGEELEIYRPDGRKFLSSVELAELVETERDRAEMEQRRAESEWHRAEMEQRRAESEQDRADQAVTQLQQTVKRLLQSGMKISELASITGLSESEVQAMQKEP